MRCAENDGLQIISHFSFLQFKFTFFSNLLIFISFKHWRSCRVSMADIFFPRASVRSRATSSNVFRNERVPIVTDSRKTRLEEHKSQCRLVKSRVGRELVRFSYDRHGFPSLSVWNRGSKRTKFIGRRCPRRIKHAIRTNARYRCVGVHPRVPWPCLNIYPSVDRGSVSSTIEKPL